MISRCPLCDAEALYVGLSRLECPTEGCPNHREEHRREPRQLEIELEGLPRELVCNARDCY